MVLAVGKMRDRHLHAACDDYLERARRHLPVEVVEVADDDELVRRIPPSSLVVALTPGGQSWDTPRFSGFIGEQMLRGTRALVFLIGGADGLSQAALARSAHRLSLSALTLPHRLARVVLCEQVYRALSILRGEPYSR
ncbi:MAG TPA: 23S rRNA (pseudouridine(1915)-N(3))-methyltransferase RlmH [Polyangia bacterium]|nr:23S rRNA (pseudouridine(1915)-N(3))-methyltransferase RlmH [Polyangia bacterium]